MEVGEVPKGIRWSAEAGGPPKVRIGGVSGRGRGFFIVGPRPRPLTPPILTFGGPPASADHLIPLTGPPPLPWLASNLGPRA